MNRNPNGERNEGNNSWYSTGAAIAGGLAAVAGGLYLLRGSKVVETPQTTNSRQPQTVNSRQTTGQASKSRPQPRVASSSVQSSSNSSGTLSGLINLLGSLGPPTMIRYRQFAGSHYDNLRIKKPDEFDMDIVIRLPLNISESPSRDQSDIIIEPQAAGFVHLRMGVQFQKLPYRDGTDWQINKTAYEWMDNSKFLLRSKFLNWWKGVVNKALNKFQRRGNVPIFHVEGVEYTIETSEQGPAVTLFIKNERKGFKLDVDLVPALKFPESRWPISSYYRQIPPSCCRHTWMVVGKPDKTAPAHVQERAWRIALHNQERELMHNSYHLRQAVRLLKKLRDEQGLKKIASYYIKTLFFWEIVIQNDEAFWRNNPAFLFRHMVKKLHAAIVNKNIPYFWNRRNNLIDKVDSGILAGYAKKLEPLIQILDNLSGDNYKLVAKYLLSDNEFKEYNEKFLRIAKL